VDTDDFTARHRERERFHTLTVPPGAWVVIRADGRAFSHLTEAHFTKPFDDRVRQYMTAAASALMTEFGAIYGCTHSDEISVALPPDSQLFGRGLEKLVSVSAGICSASFTAAAALPAHFDSRIWVGNSADDVADYFSWRQSDASRTALSTWCYWTMRQAGATAQQVTAALTGASTAQQNELLYQHGVNFTDIPAWQRRGVSLYWEDYGKTGNDPRTGAETTAIRRRLTINGQLPVKDEYRAMVTQLLTSRRQD
jgi:tRNA(His) guanylyltransferase